MSASEKLKALEMTSGGPADYSEAWRLAIALPQIIAVVEAAGAVDARKDENAWRFRPARMRDLRAALVALDEALS